MCKTQFPWDGTPVMLCDREMRRRLVIEACLEKSKTVQMVAIETGVSKPEIYRWMRVWEDPFCKMLVPQGKYSCKVSGRRVWYSQTDARIYELYKEHYTGYWCR